MINVVVEGASDVEISKQIVHASGHGTGKTMVKNGVAKLDPDIPKYILAARRENWVVFRDSDGECPVQLRARLLGDRDSPSERFDLRIAHTMSEAWLLADREGFASYFGVSSASIPNDVEHITHAKATLLSLCQGSRKRPIRDEVVRHNGHPGDLYVYHINTFARDHWSVQTAAGEAPSLERAIRRLQEMRH